LRSPCVAELFNWERGNPREETQYHERGRKDFKRHSLCGRPLVHTRWRRHFALIALLTPIASIPDWLNLRPSFVTVFVAIVAPVVVFLGTRHFCSHFFGLRKIIPLR